MPTPARRRTGLAALLLGASALTGVFVAPPIFAQTAPAPIEAPRVAAALPGFADLVERVRPAVVTITTTAQAPVSGSASSPFQPGSEQDRMFRRFFGDGAQQRQRPMHALGSGFLIDAQGRIVTNNHVVENATEVRVQLADGRELPARVLGRDARTDLALLQVDAGGPTPHLALGDSDRARVGDWVVAVGNPFGLGGTVTAGILSARGREIGAGPYDDFLQIDAPINSGNSGGPLFTQDGMVIGVNTAIFSPSGGSIGIGFAIPSNMVRQVVAQLEQNGHVDRGFLGVTTQPLTPQLASALRLPRPDGALVVGVERDGPAARAGLKPGDVVTAVGGDTVRTQRELARAVAELRPGSTVVLTVRRDGRDETVNVRLTALAEKPDTAAQPATPASAASGGQLGLALASVDPQVRQALRLPSGVRGAVVAEVRGDGPAAEAGLRAGDVIQAVGTRDVTSADEAVAAIRDASRQPGGTVALRILRNGETAYVPLETTHG